MPLQSLLEEDSRHRFVLPGRQLGALLLSLAVVVLLEECATVHSRGSLIGGIGLHAGFLRMTIEDKELSDIAVCWKRPTR